MTIVSTTLRGMAAAALLLALAWPVAAQGVPTSAPYDTRLVRLSEVLGSVHYLRNLCGERSNDWRARMEELLAVEKPEPARRAFLISAFNKGYRTFDSVYTSCTQQALDAAERYMAEGKKLSTEINSLFGE